MVETVPALLTELTRHVNVTELLHENVNVVALAEEVIAEVDLPEIIRESTGAMASVIPWAPGSGTSVMVSTGRVRAAACFRSP